MSNWNLSAGALERMMSGVTIDKPVLQILGFKTIPAPQGPDRYRILLSDGTHTVSSAMLATQLNDKVSSNQIDLNCVIKLDKFICNLLTVDKRVIVLLEVTVVATGGVVGSKIGNPQPLKVPLEPINAQTNGEASGKSWPNQSSFNTNKNEGNATFNASSSMHNDSEKFSSIASLNPYQNRWSIKARVTQKSAIKTWSNTRGEGKLFSFNLLDESGEIRVTAFKNEVDKFFNLIEPNKVYIIRKATLKTANKQYSSCNNDYEMTFSSETEVVKCDDDDASLPTMTFNFTPLDSFEALEANSLVDVIGVVKEVGDIKTVMTKQTNKELKKKDIVLVDERLFKMRVTLWGQEAESFDCNNNPVLALKGCKISDWGGKSLSLLSNSQMIINPDIPEGNRLRSWYDQVGRSSDFNEYKGGPMATVWKWLGDIKTEELPEKGEYYMVEGTIIYLKKEGCLYQACSSDDCNKKLVDMGNGTYRCEKCSKDMKTFEWRLLLTINIADGTGTQWVSCFQDTAETIIGTSSKILGNLKDTDQPEFDRVFSEANFKTFFFKLRAKMENFNDESRLKTICMQAMPVDILDQTERLLNSIDEFDD